MVRPITGEAGCFSVILLSSPISANWFVALPCYYPLVLKHLLPSKKVKESRVGDVNDSGDHDYDYNHAF